MKYRGSAWGTVSLGIAAATHATSGRTAASARLPHPGSTPAGAAQGHPTPSLSLHQPPAGSHHGAGPKRAMDALRAYAWPGNVRELENVIERALILSTGSTLRLEAPPGPSARGTAGQPALERLDEVERAHIRRLLETCAWTIDGTGHAAAKLGFNPSTLRKRGLQCEREYIGVSSLKSALEASLIHVPCTFTPRLFADWG